MPTKKNPKSRKRTKNPKLRLFLSVAKFSKFERRGVWGCGFEVDALQMLANQHQTGLVAQVVGELFDDEIGQVLFTRWVKQHLGPKLLISIENLGLLTAR